MTYLQKNKVKKDSWFFFGLCLFKKNNFFNTTLTIRNVFYNEIIEKTFFLFNIRNKIVTKLFKEEFSNCPSVVKNIKKKKNFSFIWKKPRANSKFLLKEI